MVEGESRRRRRAGCAVPSSAKGVPAIGGLGPLAPLHGGDAVPQAALCAIYHRFVAGKRASSGTRASRHWVPLQTWWVHPFFIDPWRIECRCVRGER